MGQAGVHQCLSHPTSFPSGFNSSNRMTPLWYPCLRVWEAVSHYLFNAPAPEAQPHSSQITFLARSSPPKQFGEEQATKSLSHWVISPSLLHLLLLTLFTHPHLHPGSPDTELCEPGQWEQPRDPCQGAQLWHHHTGEGEDPGRGVQEYALLAATTGCRHGSRWVRVVHNLNGEGTVL